MSTILIEFIHCKIHEVISLRGIKEEQPKNRDLRMLIQGCPASTYADFAKMHYVPWNKRGTRSKDEHFTSLPEIKEERIRCGMTF